MYMNKTKRNLIIASAIINILNAALGLVYAILLVFYKDALAAFEDYTILISYISSNVVISAINFAISLVGSILLLYAVRQKGKYFRTSQGMFIAGFIIVVLCGGMLPWILLLISFFISDVVVINTPNEVKREEKQEEKTYEDKKKQIEDLKRLRDAGIISEEEYKQKLSEAHKGQIITKEARKK